MPGVVGETVGVWECVRYPDGLLVECVRYPGLLVDLAFWKECGMVLDAKLSCVAKYIFFIDFTKGQAAECRAQMEG